MKRINNDGYFHFGEKGYSCMTQGQKKTPQRTDGFFREPGFKIFHRAGLTGWFLQDTGYSAILDLGFSFGNDRI